MSSSYQTLALTLASQADRLRLRVNGTSMFPLLRNEDIILVQTVPLDTLCPGDLITFRREKDIVTHRLVSVTPQQYLTIGDNMYSLDPPVEPEMILGRVVAIEKNAHYQPLSEPKWVTSTLVRLGQQAAVIAPPGVTTARRMVDWLTRRLIHTFLLLWLTKTRFLTQTLK